MKTTNNYINVILIITLVLLASCNADDENNPDSSTDVCDGFFKENNMETQFKTGQMFGYFEEYFATSTYYDVKISENGDVSISSEANTFNFTEDMITDCEQHEHESNIFYEDVATGYTLILQLDGTTYQLVLSKNEEPTQATLTLAGPPDLSLLADRAGTYVVTEMTELAEHTRMSVTINDDGTIDFDENIEYGEGDIEAVYDRLDCCDRIHVDLKDGSIMNFFWDNTTHSRLERIEQWGNIWYFE